MDFIKELTIGLNEMFALINRYVPNFLDASVIAIWNFLK